MTVAELLEQLESQTHGERVKTMIALGRQEDAESRDIVGHLEQGNMYERMLALYSCFGSRDGAHVRRTLADPSRLIRGLAIRLASLVCGEDELVDSLRSVSTAVRLALLARMRRRGHLGAINRYLALPTTQVDTSFCALLPFGSPETAARFMPEFTSRAALEHWRYLARLHPSLVLGHLLHEANAATEWDGPLLARVNSLLPLLAKANAPQAAALVSALARTVDLSAIKFESLTHYLPRVVADMLLAGGPDMNQNLGWWLRDSVGKLSTEQVIAIFQRSQHAFGWGFGWFGELTPDQRPAVFAACDLLLRQHDDLLPVSVVAGLPRGQRENEARKVVSSSRNRLNTRLEYARFLPWDEMRQAVDPYLHASDATTRQTALSTFVQAVAFHRTHLLEVLTELRERRTEQDGTRQVMLRELYDLPQSIWRDAHLLTLAEIIRHGLDDVGLSSGSYQQIVNLLLKLMPVHPEWAADQFLTLLRERGQQLPNQIAQTLPPATEMHVTQALLPQIEQWLARDDEKAALSLVKMFYVRSDAFALALPSLEQLLRRTRARAHAETALSLISERTRAGLADLVPELLAADASWITFTDISNWLLRRRQDLLSPYLDLKPVSGLWGTGRKPFLLPLSHPFVGGTAAQQERLANAALTRIADTTQDTYAITQATKLLPLLPAIDPSSVMALADDPRPIVRTTALFALAHLDTAAGVPTLIAALQDSRARIAIHALRSSLKHMPAAEALALLRAVPFERVTVAKEVVRLVSEIDAPEAWEQIVVYGRQPLHRDVRIALLQSLDRHLQRPEAWEILQDAARNPDQAVALATLSLPSFATYALADRGSQETRLGVLRLVAELLEHPEREARDGCREYCQRLGIADEARIVTPQLLGSINVGAAPDATTEQQEEAISAIEAFFGVCAPTDGEAVAVMMRTLLPHRHALDEAIDALDTAPRFKQRRLLPVLRAALAALESDPLVAHKRAELAIDLLPYEELEPFLLSLSGQPGLHAYTVNVANDALSRRAARFTPAQLEALEQALAASDDAQIRWLAFAVLQEREEKEGGWTDALLVRLDVYRNDPSPLVASEAQFTLTDRDTF